MIITTHEILAMRDWTTAQIEAALATVADTYVNKNDDIPATHISAALADIIEGIELPNNATIDEINSALTQILTALHGN